MKNIWTNGCFDILHAGHIELFEYAKSLGDKLYVGTDSDARIKFNKGLSRPVNAIDHRIKVLEAIRYIDGVYMFDSDTDLSELILTLNINTIVVGEEYKDKRVVGSEHCNNLIFFPKKHNLSSSILLNKYEC